MAGWRSCAESTGDVRGDLRAGAGCVPALLCANEKEEVDWWAAYQIGQRVAKMFDVKDSMDIARALVAGDGEYYIRILTTSKRY
jgi:hypothetical protein